ncbi:MAG: hypothetical protein KC561_13645, partial [Myxococcales bacterium]|nr:hypothetical protein [Myxococcales bacterium]
MAKRGIHLAIPLRYRLPNPPVHFVGRNPEMDELQGILTRGSLTVLSGLSGMGKSALVRATLHQRCKRHLGHMIYLAARPQMDGPALLGELFEVLARVAGSTTVDLPSGLDADSCLAAVIDNCESNSIWVILDDLHLVDDSFVERLARDLLQYTSNSHWLVVTRRTPSDPSLTGRVATVGAMAEDILIELGESLGLDTATAVIAASQARGCPASVVGDAQRTLISPMRGPEIALQGIPSELVDLANNLAMFRLGLTARTLLGLVPGLTDSALESLQSYGLAEYQAGSWRASPEVRKLLDPANPTAELLECIRVQSAEASADENNLWLEFLRISSSMGADLLPILEAVGQQLLQAGRSRDLWPILRDHAHQGTQLYLWLLRCALSIGDQSVLERFAPPEEGDARLWLEWSKVLQARGRLDEAIAAADRGRCLSEQGARRTEATVLVAQWLLTRGRHSDALELLADLDPPGNDVQRAEVQVLQAYGCALQGRLGEADRIALAMLSSGSHRVDSPLIFRMLPTVFIWTAKPRLAMEVITELETGQGGEAAVVLAQGPRHLQLKARLALYLGDLEHARAWLDRLRSRPWPHTILALTEG